MSLLTLCRSQALQLQLQNKLSLDVLHLLVETTSFLPSGYFHEGKSSLSSDLHRFQPIGLGFIFTSNNDGHFIGIEECSSVHKELDCSNIKRQTTVVAYFNRQKG